MQLGFMIPEENKEDYHYQCVNSYPFFDLLSLGLNLKPRCRLKQDDVSDMELCKRCLCLPINRIGNIRIKGFKVVARPERNIVIYDRQKNR